jgi:hypothetical protein
MTLDTISSSIKEGIIKIITKLYTKRSNNINHSYGL